MQYAPNLPSLASDAHAHTWMLKHWLLCLLDRGKRFTTGAGLLGWGVPCTDASEQGSRVGTEACALTPTQRLCCACVPAIRR